MNLKREYIKEYYSNIKKFEDYIEPKLIEDIGEDRAYRPSTENNLTETNIDKVIRDNIENYFYNLVEVSKEFFCQIT